MDDINRNGVIYVVDEGLYEYPQSLLKKAYSKISKRSTEMDQSIEIVGCFIGEMAGEKSTKRTRRDQIKEEDQESLCTACVSRPHMTVSASLLQRTCS